MVQRSSDLNVKLDTFKWEVERQGLLNMPEVENLTDNAQKKAKLLKRDLDRWEAVKNKRSEQDFYNAEDNVNKVIDWFGVNEKALKEIFEPYLKIF